MEEIVEKTVGMHDSNTRLDVFLTDSLKRNASDPTLHSRTGVRRSVEGGLVAVNGIVETDPGRRLKYGDRVCASIRPKGFSMRPNGDIAISVLFEDDHIIVIDKPAGLQTHPGEIETDRTVANWALAHFPAIAGVGDDPLRPGIVHRLDRNTSGVLVLAKTAEAFVGLKEAFRSRRIRKTYQVLVLGNIAPVSGEISYPLAHRTGTLKRVAVEHPESFQGEMKAAETAYRLLERFRDFDLLEAIPKTGRTHQIRAHLAAVGHPVAGDHLYGGRRMREPGMPERQLLHASGLEFELFGEKRSFEAPIPEDFHIFLVSIDGTKVSGYPGEALNR